VVATFAGVAATLAWRSRDWPLVHDAPILHYIAWRINQGAVPYRDLFDMNFPGAYLLHLAVLRGLGSGDAAWRAFDLAWLTATALAIAAFVAPWGTVAAAGSALLFGTYHLAGGAWVAGQRDFLLCLFLMLGALGVARWLERRSWWSVVLSGLVLGAAATVKPHVLALAVAFALLMVWSGRHGWGAVVPSVAVFSGSLVLAPLLATAWLGSLGALGAWREVVLDYLLPLYARLGTPDDWAFWRWQVWIGLAASVGLSLARVVVAGRFGPRHLVALVGVGYGLFHFVGQAKGWEYHLYPLAAFCSVLAFAGFDPALDGLPRRASRLASMLALAITLGLSALLLDVRGTEAARPPWIQKKERRVAEVVAWLAPRTKPGDLVQVLDTSEGGAHVLLLLGAVEPTRFVYDFHFYHDADAPVIRRLRAEFIHDLDAHPPRWVVLFERGWPTGGYERLERFPELGDRLRARYRPALRGDGWLIYARRDES
jgi:hypothetical protein